MKTVQFLTITMIFKMKESRNVATLARVRERPFGMEEFKQAVNKEYFKCF